MLHAAVHGHFQSTQLFCMSVGGASCNSDNSRHAILLIWLHIWLIWLLIWVLIEVGCICRITAREDLISWLLTLHQHRTSYEPAMDLAVVAVRGASLFPNEATNAAAIARPTWHSSSVKWWHRFPDHHKGQCGFIFFLPAAATKT